MNKELDNFGNFIGFPDKYMGPMTMKGFLGKWTAALASDFRYCVLKYHMKTDNIDAHDLSFVVRLFRDLYTEVKLITPLLLDCVIRPICSIEDIFIAVFGVESDEVYLLREFYRLYENMENWDTDFMWSDCASDSRLQKIFGVLGV